MILLMPKRILIVEDESVTALDLWHQLDGLGYQVSLPAASGEEALRMAGEFQPDLVLMDVQLAGTMDGLEASRRMQRDRPIPVVYLTAYSHFFLEDPSLMQRPGICLAKPFSRLALQTTVEVALQITEQLQVC